MIPNFSTPCLGKAGEKSGIPENRLTRHAVFFIMNNVDKVYMYYSIYAFRSWLRLGLGGGAVGGGDWRWMGWPRAHAG
jgi:hypothetical protein